MVIEHNRPIVPLPGRSGYFQWACLALGTVGHVSMPIIGIPGPELFNDLLTVLVPVGKNRPLAVKYHVLTRLETLLPITGWRCLCDYRHPPCINRTTTIDTVDEEVTAVGWVSMDWKVVVWLSLHVSPGALIQPGQWKPVEFVWSLGIEFQLLHQLSSFIQDNSRL